MCLHSKQRPLFSSTPAVFPAAEEQGQVGSAAANKKGDAGGDGGGQQLAGAGSAADGILLTGLLLFFTRIFFETFSHVFIFAHSFLCQSSCSTIYRHCGKCIVESLKCCTLLQVHKRPHARTQSCTHWRDKEAVVGASDDAAESVIDKWGVNNMLLTHI